MHFAADDRVCVPHPLTQAPPHINKPQVAFADLAAAESLDPWHPDLAGLRAQAAAAAAAAARGGRGEAALAARMLRGLSLGA